MREGSLLAPHGADASKFIPALGFGDADYVEPGQKFLAKVKDEKTGKMVRAAKPLLLALVIVNLADLVFAVDSVPAIFAITTDTFIVYTSNIFAILGLRALYFALAAMIHRFHYLKYALAAVLV